MTGTSFRAPLKGFTAAQLYSTQSYQAKNLSGIGLGCNDLSGWDFHEQNLTNASLYSFKVSDAHEREPDGSGGDGDQTFTAPHRGFTAAQLYSTQSYQAKNLSGIGLGYNDLSGWDFQEQNLTNADFNSSTLTNANLTGAVVTGANFEFTIDYGFTAAQLYSTQSYQAKNLSGIRLAFNDLTGWDFHEQNLTNANFYFLHRSRTRT